MNPEIQDEWVEALDSGLFHQGTGKLIRNEGDGFVSYCCLGVLCELARRKGICEQTTSEDGMSIRFDRETFHLPESVRIWADLDALSPKVGEDYLADLNDNGVSFSKIADRIREDL